MSHPAPESSAARVGEPLTLSDVEAVARGRRAPELAAQAAERVRASRAAVDRITDAGDAAPRVYGVNTGFGALAETRIPVELVRDLQRNLVRSHSTGVGPDLGEDAVRAMMLLRAQTLALGHSGVRQATIELLLGMLRAGVTPLVPSQGSVGASGDLAPLAHLALAMIGEGEARVGGETLPAAEALRRAGLAPLVLEAKEGLALINGTQMMTAVGALALEDARRLCRAADVAGALSLEALKGSWAPFDDRLMALRPHPGQATVATNLRRLLVASEIMESHRDCGKVQDPYSLRCMPQIHGASRDALAWARGVLEREVNSATDNPSVFVDQAGDAEIVSGGNFHGQPVALALDLAAMALAELGNVSERRVEQLVNPHLSSGLTPFLARASGLESGFMIAQVASASLVSETKGLCHPASVDSIPSSAGREDHVSMGSISALKLRRVVENVTRCLAIEVLVASAGVDQRAPLRPGAGVVAAHAAVREVVAPLTGDRPLYRDIEAVAELVRRDTLARRAEARVGALG
ncbi:MAG: histidine ammonia-lyase [Polyangiaceae bacterium]|nr:histidine ammonia-lyase [Polyangiaceae bacterium]